MGRTSKKQEPGKKAPGSAVKKKAAVRGTVMLKEAANKAVGENRREITDSLLKSTLAGNVNSARLLVSLAEGAEQGENSGIAKLRISVADAWATELQWTGESAEETAETGSGGHETES
jgi:hypothetical protein